MKIVAWIPSSRAAQATAWPWLPALAAITPAARSAGVSVASLLTAPRILNEPGALQVLGLQHASAGRSRARATPSRRRASRARASPIRSRAASMSARVGAVFVVNVEHLAEDLVHGASAGRAAGAAPGRGAARARGRPAPHSPDAGAPAPRRPRTPRPRGSARGAPRAPVGLERRPGAPRSRRQSSSMPSPRSASVSTIGGGCRRPEREHLPDVGRRRRARAGWSRLLIAITSGISMIPAFSACTASPEPGMQRRARPCRRSRARPISLWPVPTVSRKTTSLPDASRRSSAWSVASASPPAWPRVPIERMKTPGSRKCSASRIRSPSSAPWVNGLDGSTEMTPDRPAARADAGDERRDQARLADARAGP